MKGFLILAVAMTLQLTMALECYKCLNDVNSDQDKAYCLTNVEHDAAVQVETCADGVTSCYIHDHVGLYRETREIRTIFVSRGCMPDGEVQCDSGRMVNDDLMSYTSCCTDDRCNEAHLVPLT